ncbi:S9 family peptidase [Terriglobus sp. ADX1]|uniref:S9 family peptidase n=1 Tax=Terriglobus sp. ADX1 TaxID=2794063 RepID=UPI002FE68728
MNHTFFRSTAALALGFAAVACAQQTLTAADYARAESRLAAKTTSLVDHAVTQVTWLKNPAAPGGGDRFWYRDTANGNTTFMLVDAAKGTKAPAFDNAQMARGLQAAGIPNPQAGSLPITDLELTDLNLQDVNSLVVTVRGERYKCTISTMLQRTDGQDAFSCAKQPVPPAHQQGAQPAVSSTGTGGNAGMSTNPATAAPLRPGRDEAVVSPDGKKAAFIRDWNLWVRDISTGEEKPLTTDGAYNYGYATDNAGWTHSNRAVLVWSPDSKKIATFQQDQRKTGMMYLVSTTVGHPTLDAWPYPLPGDKDVTMIERVVIDVDAAKVTRLKMPADQHRSSLCDDISCRGGGWDDVQWSADAKTLAFLSTSRDHRTENLRMADVATGDVHDVMKEVAATYFESGNGRVNWKYLSTRNEILWFSERSNWGQLYLYDAANGKLKREVTKGDWNVTQVLRVDEKTGDIFFEGVGREKGWDPYYSAVYRGNLDGKGVTLLSPEPMNHAATFSEDGKYFVDVFSTPQVPQTTVLRDANGKIVAEIAKADITRLKATGWQAPINITVKARDGKTDLYGLMFKPSNFDATKKYPIVNYIYPGPQTGSVGSRSFSAARGDSPALAELGFIVVSIDGMGTPWRSKKFHDAYFGDMGDNTLPDQVAGMKELAAKNQWIDIDKAGIWGHSGGGFATADAMFRYPDFFKVGWSESGNHDNRNYEDDWAEKWIGLDDAANKKAYDDQANEAHVSNLKGKLMLVHGTMDDNVPPNNTLVVVDALMKANKDFDLLMIPNVHHGYADQSYYIMRRRWDYFVKNLAGGTPPKEYSLATPQAQAGRRR